MYGIPIELIRLLIGVVLVLAFVATCVLVLVYAERKIAGRVQRRPGPYEVGPHGLLQPLADAGKLIGKQQTMPSNADRILFWLAPTMSFVPVLLLFLPLPFGPILTVQEVNLGLLLILAFSGFSILSVILAGLSSNNKYGLLGAARAVSQSVAYEIPLLLCVLAITFMTGTLNLSTIVEAQGSWPWQWNVMVQPLAFVLFFCCALAETNRAPFDMAEAESELTAGFHTEYSGMAFSLFFMAEYANMVVVCCVATALFLGGWKGPFFDGVWWFLLKAHILLLIMIWVRWTFPRVRFDQLLNLNWKWLLPVATLNLLATLFLVKLF